MTRVRPQPSLPPDAAAFFSESAVGLAAYRRVQALLDALGPCDLRVARTQVGWARRRGFAVMWLPGRWLSRPTAEVVLTITSDHRLDSARWKEVVEVRPGLFTHHLELHSVDDIDKDVVACLAEAYRAAE